MRIFVIVNAIGFAVLALLAAWLLAGVNPRRPWDAAAFALSPALLLTGLVNWDMLAVVLVAGALWAWARERPRAHRRADRARYGGQAVPAVPARRRAGDLPAPTSGSATSGWPPRRGRGLGGRQPAGVPLRAGRSGRSSGRSTPTGVPTSGRSGWSSQQALDRTGNLVRLRPAHDQRRVVAVLRRLVRRRAGARADLTVDPAAGPARLPDRGRLPAGQQGLLAAVRAVAAAAGRAGPPALARPADLAGRRGRLLRRRVVVPRRLPRARVRRGRRLLLGGDADPDRGRALPRRGRGARHLVPAARPGAGGELVAAPDLDPTHVLP